MTKVIIRYHSGIMYILSAATVMLSTAYFLFLWRKIYKIPKIDRYDIDSRFTNAATIGNLVFMSGQVGTGSTIEEQTESALEEVALALKKAGSDKSRILELTIWLKDIKRDYAAMNSVYDRWIVPGKPPCRACVQSELYSPDCLVEVRAIASKC
jgi:enamine deaminase RidA (YjgF/YER057c/UK114 family)